MITSGGNRNPANADNPTTPWGTRRPLLIPPASPTSRHPTTQQSRQAFFPRDRTGGGDLDELTDTDRESTKRIYRLLYDTVEQLEGALQIIALDHAEFEEDWFQASVIERWRDGDALIPASWLMEAPTPVIVELGSQAEADLRAWFDDSVGSFDDDPWAKYQDNDGNYHVAWSDDEHAGTTWRDSGFSPSEAEMWSLNDFDIDEAERWRRAEFEPDQAVDWRRAGFDSDEARTWLDVSFTASDAEIWRQTGLEPWEAAAWRTERFSPTDASLLSNTGMDSETAAAYRDEGLSIEESLRRDGEDDGE
jgi:hypothetical protein